MMLLDFYLRGRDPKGGTSSRCPHGVDFLPPYFTQENDSLGLSTLKDVVLGRGGGVETVDCLYSYYKKERSMNQCRVYTI